MSTVQNLDDVKTLEKLNSCEILAGHGPCSLDISPWSPELGSVSAAVGPGTWVRVWNLPFHCWSSSTVADVLQQIGDLVTIGKNKSAPIGVLRVLVRLHGRTSLPHEIKFSVGMRKFFVLVTDERNKDPSFSASRSRYIVNPSLAHPNEAAPPIPPAVPPPSRHRFTHEVAASDKGKTVLDKNNLKRKRLSPSLDDGLQVSSLHHVTGAPPEKADFISDPGRVHRGTRVINAPGI